MSASLASSCKTAWRMSSSLASPNIFLFFWHFARLARLAKFAKYAREWLNYKTFTILVTQINLRQITLQQNFMIKKEKIYD